MRVIKRNINAQEGSGAVTLIPQEPEDMWHIYNIIRPNDTITASAVRKVQKNGVNATVRTTLTTRVLSIDFDVGAHEIHVPGKVCVLNEHVPQGAHHTLDLEVHRQFTLYKEEGGWDSVALEQLQRATDVNRRAETYAVIMQEGIANICVVTEYQTVLRQRVEMAISKKRSGHGAGAHEKGLQKFFDTTLATLLRHLDVAALMSSSTSSSTNSPSNNSPTSTTSNSDPSKTPPLLLASPGFVASAFHAHMLSHATITANKPLLQYAKSHTLILHSSTGHLHSLSEVLSDPAVKSRLSDTRYARETALMERLLSLIREDDGRAWYGPREVERAVEKGAVGRGGGVLLLSDKLFRAQDIATRRRWVELVEKVKKVEGGEVRILSSAHESGKRLEGLGDIAAILTFPLEGLDEDEEGGEDGENAALEGGIDENGDVFDESADGRTQLRQGRYDDIEDIII